MHLFEQMEIALACAEQLGYRVRHEYLGGVTGGACEFAGNSWIFIDLAISPAEQLEQLLAVLESHPHFLSRREIFTRFATTHVTRQSA